MRPLASLNFSSGRLPPVGRRRPTGPRRTEPSRRVLPPAPSRRPGRRLQGGPTRPPVLLRHAPRLVLWEPNSGTEIPLPCLCPVVQVFLSGDPLESTHWMAVATKHRWPAAHILFFWRPGDAAWSGPAKVPCAKLHSVEFHAGNIYCIDGMFNVSIYDLKLGTASPPVLLRCFGMCPNQASESWPIRKYWKDSVRAVHVVACRGELLLVLLFHGRRPSLMEVYRPAWTPAEWPFRVGERVTDLGGYALFLGCGDAVALCAKEYPYPEVHKQENGCWPYSWFCPRRPFLKKQLA
uniref:KIB1-4 beta-propeller domain-containing protein n=1 Tax=Aegilops tauschii subsp. strangulata TaxID=200361 RepID=A0A452YJD3_AEGTS